jgi:hypothetical protein
MTFILKKRWSNISEGNPEVPEVADRENIEAYVDDAVIKTTEEDQLITDLTIHVANSL